MSAHPGHLVLLPFAILGVTSLVSYQRAKAESLGISAKGGLMERAERMILLGIGFLSVSFLVPVLWVMLVLTSVTAVGRFVKVWRLAEAPAPRSVVGCAGPAPAPGLEPQRCPVRWSHRLDCRRPAGGRGAKASSRAGPAGPGGPARPGPGNPAVRPSPWLTRPSAVPARAILGLTGRVAVSGRG